MTEAPDSRPIPLGLENLLRKAAIDPAFRERVLEDRSGCAGEAGIELLPAEAAMLDGATREHLEAMLDGAAARAGVPKPPWAARPENVPEMVACGGIAPDYPYPGPRGCCLLAPFRLLARLFGG